MTGDDLVPLGSTSNRILIHVGEDWGHGETDQLSAEASTEIMTTPEFGENLIDESFPSLANEGADFGPTSDLAPIGPPASGDPEEPQNPGQSSVDHVRLDDKALKMAESFFDALKDCCSHEAAKGRG